jgi:hypothetical protein
MRFPLLVAVLLFAFARPSSAEPCAHCPSPGKPVAERDRHALLIHGIVFAARDSTLPPAGKGPPPFVHLVSVHVKGVWKGNPSRDLVLRLDPCAARAIDPQPGEAWILYADSVAGDPVIPPCTRSALRTSSNEEFTALGPPRSLVVPRAKKPTPH